MKQRYAELLSLTQLFLLRESSLQDIHMVDPALLAFFQSKVILDSPPKKVSPPLVLPVSPVQDTKIQVQSIPSSPVQSSEPQSTPPPPKPALAPARPGPEISSPKPPIIQHKTDKTKEFSLEPVTSTAPTCHTQEFLKLSQILFPEWTLCETIPNDAIAQKNKNAWVRDQEIPAVVILSFHDDEQQLAFLKNVAQAISLRLAPARVLSAPKLEKSNEWERLLDSSQLHLIIASDYGLYLQPKLMHFYREEPNHSKHFLNHIPLLLLSDLSLYLKETQLKPLLWRAICNEFKTLQLKAKKAS